ncbi:transporter [Streptomyces sp. SID5473]|uniref:Transporter n=1 Tax=Streptomyces tsukubensis (strain DSM 42081 / NBRC 108919 / NRRL 18488 / 9993) TaxID=1114943 RepID=A0A7G3UMX2_STRT9|nr:transporter [Streptomyces sp. SID5473]QKM71747.1 transporter [Streptomyces tsukubensis NRRL18488]TAI43021.1 transporter [Streptomyces tsukubensis]
MSTGALAAVFVRLKLSLLRNGLRQSTARKTVFVISLVLAVLFAVLQLLGFVAMRGSENVMIAGVLYAGVLALGWAVMPLFFPSGDETLDPTRLVMLPLRPGPLVTALTAASLVGTGPLFTFCVLLGAGIAVAHSWAAAAVAVVAVPLALLGCIALARSVAAANIRLLTSRKGRDLALLSGLVIAVGLQAVNLGFQELGRSEEGLGALAPAADVVRWVPIASAIASVDATSDGAYGTAAAQLALSAAALGGLLWWWRRILTGLMTAPDGSTIAAASEREVGRGGRGLNRFLPEGRTGAVMQRALRYLWRDPKTKAGLVSALAIGALIPLVNVVQGTGSVYFAAFATSMLGMQMYNQFGQDTSAFWMVLQTMSTTRDAYEELRARAVALLLIALPYTVLVTVGIAFAVGDLDGLVPALGLSLAVLGAMLGTGAYGSARYPYSIPQDSAYKNVGAGQASLAWISLGGGAIVSALLCSPLIVAVVMMKDSDARGDMWLLLPAGALYGALLAWAGLKLAAPLTARRGPEILAAVSKG